MTILPFPRPTRPRRPIEGVVAELAAARALLAEIDRNLPPAAGQIPGDRELVIFAHAVRRLSAARPATPAGVDAATIDEAMVLADLIGQALRYLPAATQAVALPQVLRCLLESLEHGPEETL